MEKGFGYYAFISYNHKDEKWARWLQNKLENYKLPATIRKENTALPKEIRPVFRDKTSMGAGILEKTIRENLERSQYLIVICSPKAVTSKWVGDEIRAFAEMGRSDRIIPFIVDGVPNSNDSQECFHPHLKEKIPEPLGINIKEIGKQQAFIKTVAKLLNLRFEVLWDRFRIAQRKQRLLAAVAGLLCLAGLGWAWDNYYPKYEYYVDYVDRNGIPEGIFKLDKKYVKVRHAHYRFVYREKILRKVVYANSVGTPIEHSDTEYTDRPSILELEYVGRQLYKTFLKNKQGQTTAVYLWDNDYNGFDIKSETGETDAVLGNSYMFLTNLYENKGRVATIKRFKLERDGDGYIKRREYKQINNHDKWAASNIDGVWGLGYDLDNLGRIEKIWYLGPDMKPFLNKVGAMGKKYEYDGYGNISKTTYFGKDEEPVLNEMLWATCVAKADTNGNIISEYYIDQRGYECYHKDGYAKATLEYDGRGNVEEIAFFEADGYECLNKDGFSKVTYKNDARGNITEAAFFDKDGNPCLNNSGYAKETRKYDWRGNITERAFFGTEGEPCSHNDGYAIVKNKYNRQGYITEAAYFDVDGNPGHKDGYAKITFKYDGQRNVEEIAYFGTDGKAYLNKADYAKVTYIYDDQGNKTDEAYFGTDDEPCFNKEGFSIARYKHDKRGNIVEEAYFGTDGKQRCFHIDGYSIGTWMYDDETRIGENAYFGTDGEPCMVNGGYSKITGKYDEWGKTIELAYFGTDGEPCFYNECFSIMKVKYDGRGNAIEIAYFDTDGEQPCFNEEGFAKETRKYDRYNRYSLEEIAYFGIDGKPCLNNWGYAKVTFRNDFFGNPWQAILYDVDGNVISTLSL